jgi:ribosomal protein S18 acetylase RimI-like enzyme
VSIHIRTATPADAKRLADLHAECFARAWNVAAFEKLLSEQTNFALLAGQSEKLFTDRKSVV